jgi:Concanavalin A-like lectin/glucanases superfamily
MRKSILIIVCFFISHFVRSQTTYTFNGNGNWSMASNWSNSAIPPTTLPAGSTINISPASGDSCVLDYLQTIAPGAFLNVSNAANFIISGNLNVVGDELKQGLLAYYPFNGAGSDESGNGYDLVVNGAVLIDSRFGKTQKAYQFNGSSDFMLIPNILKADSLREFTISVWVNPESLGHNSILSFLSKYPYSCSNYLGFNYSNSVYQTWHQMITEFTPNRCTTSIIKDSIVSPLNKWTHIVIVQRYNTQFFTKRYDARRYYNGQKLLNPELYSYGSNPIAICFSQGGIIGGNNTTGNFMYNFNFFKGGIDDLRIYDRALSDDEVSQLYNLNE